MGRSVTLAAIAPDEIGFAVPAVDVASITEGRELGALGADAARLTITPSRHPPSRRLPSSSTPPNSTRAAGWSSKEEAWMSRAAAWAE